MFQIINKIKLLNKMTHPIDYKSYQKIPKDETQRKSIKNIR